MTSTTSNFVEFVLDQLGSLRGVASGRFFGGVGLSCDRVQFAMVMGGTLYFVVDDSTREKYVQMGGSSFSYQTKKGQVAVRKYYSVPAEILEDQEQLVSLARESIQVANSAKKTLANRVTHSRVKHVPV